LRYGRAVDGRARAQLVERHLDLARRAAALLHPRVQDYIALDELAALASAGLAEAAQRYDPARGVAFTTFAWYRINGTMLDGLRKATQLPRRTWARLVALRAANEYLENHSERERGAIQRGASPATGSDAVAAIERALSAIRTIYLTSLEGLRDQGFDPEAPAPHPADQIDATRQTARLRDAIERLPDKERALVTKHYWEGKNLLEAGEELGISKSWASRLHAQAVDKLRAILDEDD